MSQTFAEKVLAAKAGKEKVVPNEIVEVEPDLVLSHDNSAAISKHFKKIGVEKVWNKDRVAIVLDHCVPAADSKHATNHQIIREFVKDQGLSKFMDIGRGVCHQVVLEEGWILPGQLAVGSDSHTPTYGAVGAFSAGIGRTEAAATWATGEIWLKVPVSIKFWLTGRLSTGVTAKDLVLKIIADIGADGADYASCEFLGPAVSSLTVADRMVLCNMAAEMGAKNGVVPADDETFSWLKGQGVPVEDSVRPVLPDEGAAYDKTYEYDLSGIEPMVAAPHTVDTGVPVGDLAGLKINQVVLGTCTNGRLSDLRAAASMLKGKKVSPDTRLIVIPASSRIYAAAIQDGTLLTLLAAGAVVCNPGCGPCLGAHQGALAPGEICLATSNRNFKGRMGCKEASIYLGSPYTAAATAIAGAITDPRDLL